MSTNFPGRKRRVARVAESARGAGATNAVRGRVVHRQRRDALWGSAVVRRWADGAGRARDDVESPAGRAAIVERFAAVAAPRARPLSTTSGCSWPDARRPDASREGGPPNDSGDRRRRPGVERPSVRV